ncbi:MAG: CHAT domain-containing protein, partial [Cyclobacteriaceae bacterium]
QLINASITANLIEKISIDSLKLETLSVNHRSDAADAFLLRGILILKFSPEQHFSLYKSLDLFFSLTETKVHTSNSLDFMHDRLVSISKETNNIELLLKLFSSSNQNLLDKYGNQLLKFLERQKSLITLENLVLDRSEISGYNLIVGTEKLTELEERISDLKNQILIANKKTSSVSYSELQLELIKTECDLQIFKNNFYRNKVNLNKSIIPIAKLRSILNGNSILLHYYAGWNCNYILSMSHSEIKLFKLQILQDSVLQQFRNSLDPATANSFAEENYQNYVQSAYAIYKSQLKPVLDKFPGTKKIYVIPDGQLHHIPFEALISELPTDSTVNYKKLKYLINDYTFSYANSATTLFKTKSLFNRLKPSGQNILAFAPSYKISNSSLTLENIEKRPLSSLRGELTDLQWNSEEVNNIKQQFEGQFLINEQATEAQFKEQASKHNILHLSMHAVVDQEDPMYSYLAFAPDPQDTSSRDGFLHAFEIYDMDLNAEMAVLSACNTGYGKLYKGEGPMSLAKAFTYAGCPSVVMSHWPADDRSSSEIMGFFYENLAAGMKKDEALRKAKLDFLASAPPFRQAPAYWNNFVVMGDVSPIVKDQTQLYLLAMLVVVLFFALVWLLLRLLFRKKKVSLVS